MPISETKSTFKIELDWKATALALVLLPGLLWLGYWQLDRAEEKSELKTLYAQRAVSAPIAISQIQDPAQMRYQPIVLRGKYLPEWNLLLDNRIFHGKFGYEILTAFELSDSLKIVWVNRGWLQGDGARLSLPDIPQPQVGEHPLLAEIYVPQGEPFQLGEDNNKKWPRVIQTIKIEGLQQEMQRDMFPYSVRLAKASIGVLKRNWLVINIEPAKHVGYAVQWFAMAAMAVLIMILANTNLWLLWKQRKK